MRTRCGKESYTCRPLAERIRFLKTLMVMILIIGIPLLIGKTDKAHAAKDPNPKICFCHNTHSPTNPYNTICTNVKALQNAHEVNHGDSDFGCFCGDGICDPTSPEEEDCGTCPQDCGACPECGDGNQDLGEECGEPGLTCTAPETCGGCRCVPPVECDDDSDCDNGNVCDGTETCGAGNICLDGIPLECGDADACTADDCDPIAGCIYPPVVCPPDGNPCTIDDCDSELGCTYTIIPGCQSCKTDDECQNGTVCDGQERCIENVCVPAVTPLDCDDSDACTNDTCDPVDGCQHDSITCDDLDECTQNLCDPATGCYYTEPTLCEDKEACTQNLCDATVGCYYDVPTDCDDGDACTADGCAEPDGCFHDPYLPGDCDDKDPCTVDACDSAIGCTHTLIPECIPCTTDEECDDGNACNGDEFCGENNTCSAGTPLECDDENPCTIDSCDPAQGCVTTPVDCDDGNLCNGVESCEPKLGCVEGIPLVCDDESECTDDTCNPDVGCLFIDNGTCGAGFEVDSSGVYLHGDGCSCSKIPTGPLNFSMFSGLIFWSIGMLFLGLLRVGARRRKK